MWSEHTETAITVAGFILALLLLGTIPFIKAPLGAA